MYQQFYWTKTEYWKKKQMTEEAVDEESERRDFFEKLVDSPEDSSREAFEQHYKQFMRSIGRENLAIPTIGRIKLDLYLLYNEVDRRGGVSEVIAQKQWRPIGNVLGIPPTATSASHSLRLSYYKLLYQYELRFREKVRNYNEILHPKGVVIKPGRREGKPVNRTLPISKSGQKRNEVMKARVASAEIMSRVINNAPCYIESKMVMQLQNVYDAKPICMQIQSRNPYELQKGLNALLELSFARSPTISFSKMPGRSILRELCDLMEENHENMKKNGDTVKEMETIRSSFAFDVYDEFLPRSYDPGPCLLNTLMIIRNFSMQQVNATIIASEYRILEPLVAIAIDYGRKEHGPFTRNQEIFFGSLDVLGNVLPYLGHGYSLPGGLATNILKAVAEEGPLGRENFFIAMRTMGKLLKVADIEEEARTFFLEELMKDNCNRIFDSLMDGFYRCRSVLEVEIILKMMETACRALSGQFCACSLSLKSNLLDMLEEVLQEVKRENKQKKKLSKKIKKGIIESLFAIMASISESCGVCKARSARAKSPFLTLQIISNLAEIPDAVYRTTLNTAGTRIL